MLKINDFSRLSRTLGRQAVAACANKLQFVVLKLLKLKTYNMNSLAHSFCFVAFLINSTTASTLFFRKGFISNSVIDITNSIACPRHIFPVLSNSKYFHEVHQIAHVYKLYIIDYISNTNQFRMTPIVWTHQLCFSIPLVLFILLEPYNIFICSPASYNLNI